MPNEEHRTVFWERPPMIGWHKAHILKDYLERAKINNVDTKESKSARCNGKRCQVCQYIEETCDFEKADYKLQYRFYCLLIHCTSCSKQYVESNMTDFRYRFNNYKGAFCKVSKLGKATKVNQEHFHLHFKLPEHNVMDNSIVTLIDRADNRKELRRREHFWQNKLNTFHPHELNERNVSGEYY